MKLRNKKTGNIVEALISAYGISGDVAVSVRDSNESFGYADIGRYKTLAELNEEWEDYEPTEPLIKDEKVRNVIRSWAEANDMDVSLSIFYREDRCTLSALHAMRIEFSKLVFADLEKNRSYTITELCGEEEE